MALIGRSPFSREKREEEEEKPSRRRDVKGLITSALEAGQHALNPSGSLLDEYVPGKSEAQISGGSFSNAVATEGGLNPHFESGLQKMIAASGGKISVSSGYRSPQRQAELYQAALKKYGSEKAARKWVAPPGKSNHNKGLAADLKFADDATRRWAHANAAKFGLRFPMGHEPWHVEPAGAR